MSSTLAATSSRSAAAGQPRWPSTTTATKTTAATQQRRQPGPLLRTGQPPAVPERDRHEQQRELQHEQVEARHGRRPGRRQHTERVGQVPQRLGDRRVGPGRGTGDQAERRHQRHLRTDGHDQHRPPHRRRQPPVGEQQQRGERGRHDVRRGAVDEPHAPGGAGVARRRLREQGADQPDGDEAAGDGEQQPAVGEPRARGGEQHPGDDPDEGQQERLPRAPGSPEARLSATARDRARDGAQPGHPGEQGGRVAASGPGLHGLSMGVRPTRPGPSGRSGRRASRGPPRAARAAAAARRSGAGSPRRGTP